MSSNFNGSWGLPKTNTVPTDDSPMFGDYNIEIGGLSSLSEDSEVADPPEQVTLKSWSVVLVMIAMSIIFIAWCAYATYTSYKSSATPNRPSNETGGEKRCKLSRKERTQLISEYLDREGNQTTIQEGDILPGADQERGDTTESNHETILVVRKHVKNSSHGNGHGLEDQEANEGVADDLHSSDTNARSQLSITCHIHDACVICLDPYKVNDTVVWSSSSESACPHVFHTDCFIEYLASHRGRGVPCPSCRQAYFSEDIFQNDPCPSSASLADSNSTARGHIGSGPSTDINSDDIESGTQVDGNT